MKKYIVAFLAVSLTSTAAWADFSETANVGAIPDNIPAGISSTIVGSGGGMVTDVEVSLNGFTHTWVGDLIGTVTKDGTTVMMFNRPGTDFDNPPFGHDVDLNGLYMFADGEPDFHIACMNADGSFGGNGSLPPGLYGPLEPFSDFNGLTADGNWVFNISDNAAADTGAITSWTLTVTTGGGGCSNPLGDVNGDGVVTLADVNPFVALLTGGGFQCEADINEDGIVSLADVNPFVVILTGG